MSSYYTYTYGRSFEPRRPKLFKLLHLDENYDEVDWDAVISRLQSYPHEASWFVPSGDLSTLRRGGYYEDFIAELKKEQEENEATGKILEDCNEMKPPVVEGWTALHTACYLDPPPHAIKALIDAFPEATGMKSATGYTPLHFCSFREFSPTVTKIILLASPTWVLSSKNSSGETPLDRLSKQWEVGVKQRHGAFSNDFIGSTKSLEMDAEEAKILDKEMSSLWKKIDMILRASTFAHASQSQYDKLSVSKKQNLPYNPLHIASYLGCSPALLQYAYLLDRRQARSLSQSNFQNTPKRHPLALAVSSPHIHEKNIKEILMTLLRFDSSASSIPDEEGRLPIHIAIENRITWSQGVENLLKSSPQALNTRDIKTFLYPFQMAAIGENSCLTSTFLLLRNAPENARGLADPPSWVRTEIKLQNKFDAERKEFEEKISLLQNTISEVECERDQLQSENLISKGVNEELRKENESLRRLLQEFREKVDEGNHHISNHKRIRHE